MKQRTMTPRKLSKDQEEKDHNHILASATVSASYNMMFQLSFRLLTFILNAFILRYITKDLLGVVNVRLTLLFMTTQFIAREAFRKACISKSEDTSWVQIINLVWITFPLGVMCASVFALIWMYLLEQPDPRTVLYYHVGVITFAASTVITLLAEPVRMVSQIMLYSRLRFVAEGLAQFVKCLMDIILIAMYPHWGLIAFCVSQIVFAICFSGCYYVYFIHEITVHRHDENFPFKSFRDFFPRKMDGKAWIDWKLAKLTWSFMKQSFLKQILTDGERYIMTFFGVLTFADQGVYDVINNLGSLATRFIFLPIEESAYLLFSQILERGKLAKEQTKGAIEMASGVLECLLKLVLLISLVILVFGYAYSFLLLDWYGGSILSSESGPMLLRSYCGYVLLLAVNGVSEGFVFATMSKQEVDKYNHKMLLFSAIFLASAYYFTTSIGSVGFILANSFNMLARICHSVYYIVKFYRQSDYFPLRGLIPSLYVVGALTASFVATVISERMLCCHYGLLWQGLHVLIGAAFLFLTLIVIYVYEKNLVKFVKDHYKKSRKSKNS